MVSNIHTSPRNLFKEVDLITQANVVTIRNPAFDQIDVKQVRFEDSSPRPERETIAISGKGLIKVDKELKEREDALYARQLNQMTNDSPPKARFKRFPFERMLSPSQWPNNWKSILLWVVIVCCFAGIITSVVFIIWMETYSGPIFASNQTVHSNMTVTDVDELSFEKLSTTAYNLSSS